VTIEPTASLAAAARLLAEKRIVAMTRKVSTCNETELVSNIMERMSAGKFRHMPVVDQRQPVGMVSIADVVKYRLQAMERDSAAMRDYILTS
jgi:predicted transcriptional regulator